MTEFTRILHVAAEWDIVLPKHAVTGQSAGDL